jgi:two-component system, NarL family, response regulator
MPVMSGVQAAAICERVPGARVIIVTSYHTQEDIYSALRAGAQGYLLKDPSRGRIHRIYSCCERRRRNMDSSSRGSHACEARNRPIIDCAGNGSMRAMSQGKSNKEIGVELNICEATVKVHMTYILEKLKVAGRTEAINVAARRGLVHMDSPAAGSV